MKIDHFKDVYKELLKGRQRREVLAAIMLPNLYARRFDYGMGTSKIGAFVKMAMDFAGRIVKAR